MTFVNRFHATLKYLHQEVYKDMPLQHLRLFVEIGSSEGIGQDALAETLSMSKPSVSRGTTVLEFKYSLILTRRGAEKGRRFTYWLTDDGKEVFNRIMAIIAGETC